MTILSLTQSEAAKAAYNRSIEEGAYSYGRYNDAAWKANAEFLAARGLDARQIEAVLRSKHMRWAADLLGDEHLDHAMERYLQEYPRELNERELAQLVESTF